MSETDQLEQPLGLNLSLFVLRRCRCRCRLILRVWLIWLDGRRRCLVQCYSPALLLLSLSLSLVDRPISFFWPKKKRPTSFGLGRGSERDESRMSQKLSRVSGGDPSRGGGAETEHANTPGRRELELRRKSKSHFHRIIYSHQRTSVFRNKQPTTSATDQIST